MLKAGPRVRHVDSCPVIAGAPLHYGDLDDSVVGKRQRDRSLCGRRSKERLDGAANAALGDDRVILIAPDVYLIADLGRGLRVEPKEARS